MQHRDLQHQLFIHIVTHMDPNGITQLPVSKCQFEAFLVTSFDLGLCTGTLLLEAVFGEYPWVTFPTCLNITNTFGARYTHTLPYISLRCCALHCSAFTSVWISKTIHVQYWAISELLSSRCWVLTTPLLPSSALGTGHRLSSPSSSRICWFVNGACSFGWFV